MLLRYQLLFLAVLLNSAIALASTKEADIELDDLLDMSLEDLASIDVTVASGKSETLLKSISTVSVITKEQINNYNFRSVSEAVSTIAGFDTLRSYFKKSIPTSRGILQDHYANKVLIMVNNIPTWHAATGEGHINRINIHDVEKIEVLKGPASVLYGTNAYSGAINIVLKKSDKDESHAYVGMGSHQQRMIGASQSLVSPDKDAALFVSLNAENSNVHGSIFTDETGQTGHFDDFTNSRNMTFYGNYNKHNFLFNAYNDKESYLGVAPRFSSGANNNHKLRGYLLGYQYEYKINEKSQINFSTKYDWNDRIFSRSADDNTRGQTWGFHTTSTINYSQKFLDNFNFGIGADHDFRENNEYRSFLEDTDTTLTHSNLEDKNIWEYSLFSHIGYEKDKWKWDIGFRSVENERFGQSLSSRGTLVYSFSDSSSVKFIAGQSYRSPSIFELYFIPPGNTVFGNPDLSPEESTSYEIAYLKSFNNFFVQTNAYYSIYSNKIYRTKGNVTLSDGTIITDTNVYQNGDNFSVKGIELEARYSTKNLNAFTNLDIVYGNDGDKETGSNHYNFKYIPDFTLSAGVSKKINNYMLSSVAHYRDSAGGNTEKIDDSLTIDLSASYNHTIGEKEAKHRISLTNITDETPQVADYVRRRGLNAVPLALGRAFLYEFSINF